MPAIYTHDRFGKAVISTLPPSFRDFYQKYLEAFHLGFQGPDILFYYKPLRSNPIKTRGMDMHVKAVGGDFFRAQGEKLLQTTQAAYGKGANDDVTAEEIFAANGAKAAYLAGFLCHFTLDVFCHPTIDAHSVNGLSHGKIESETDKFVRRKDGVPLRGYNVAKDCVKGENGCDVAVAETLDASVENVREAIATMRRINGWFTCKCGAFHVLAHSVLKLAGMERKFGDMFMHKKDDPRCVGLCETLYEKFQAAVPEAARLIVGYFTRLRGFLAESVNEEIFRCNYSGIPL